MHILITGGTGTIGRRLSQHLIKHRHKVTVLSRRPYRPATLPSQINFARWDGKSAGGWEHLVEEVDAIVNLAGAGLADGRWTAERKKLLVSSRVDAGNAVSEAIATAENKPKVVIQSSAIGYYGTHQNMVVTESGAAGDDFLANLCKQWEASTEAIDQMGVRRVVVRTGVVLDMDGGAFPRMVLPFRFFAGGPVSNGRQWVSWIHYLDVVDGMRFLIEHGTVSGPVNLTAPNPVQNRTLAKAIGKALKRPALAPAPGFVLKIIFGEMSTVLLDGQQVLPGCLNAAGYQFKFPTVRDAVQDLLG
jgi:uncharacterized protein (TIGR01777 family)